MKHAARAIVIRDGQLLVIHRNKFGKEYYTLPGGGVNVGENLEQSLRREMQEETGLQLGAARAVFVEHAGAPYGTQYVYLMEYLGGEPVLHPGSDEAKINQLGQNLYQPMWLSISDLPAAPFVSERLKRAVLRGIQDGFPEHVTEVVQ